MTAKRLSDLELDALVARDVSNLEPSHCELLSDDLNDAQDELERLDPTAPDFQRQRRRLEARIRAIWIEMRAHHCPGPL